MTDNTFRVVFSGSPLPGSDRDTAIRNFAQLFKRTPEQVAGAFSGKPMVLKKGLSDVDAEKYCRVLEKAGLAVHAEAEKPAPARNPETDPETKHEAKPEKQAAGISLSMMDEHAPIAAAPVVEKPVVVAPKISASLALVNDEPHEESAAPGLASAASSSRMTCPSCGHEQAKSDVCEACHLVIAKFRPRKPEAAAPAETSAVETTHAEATGDGEKPSFFGRLFGKLKGG